MYEKHLVLTPTKRFTLKSKEGFQALTTTRKHPLLIISPEMLYNEQKEYEGYLLTPKYSVVKVKAKKVSELLEILENPKRSFFNSQLVSDSQIVDLLNFPPKYKQTKDLMIPTIESYLLSSDRQLVVRMYEIFKDFSYLSFLFCRSREEIQNLYITEVKNEYTYY